MKKAYKQIISAQTDIMAECYYIDEDGKRVHNDKFWIAPIVCFGLTENGDIISIHAPREGSDQRQALTMARCSWSFLSTLPARGATVCIRLHTKDLGISIHAPREGSDPPPHNRRHVGMCNRCAIE